MKSLFAFATRMRYVEFDVAQPLRLPACKETLSERILEEDEVHRLIAGEPIARNRLILQLLYMGGMRNSELVGFCWR